MRQFGLLLATVMCSTASYAVVNGSPVTQSEYQDYVVSFSNAHTANCSGTLLGGEYLLTARHCIMPISGANSGVIPSYSLSIKQGVTKSTALSYERTFTMASSFSSVNASADKDALAADIYNDVVANYPLNGGANLITWPYVSDLVILKLNSPIPHTTGGILAPIYNPTTDATLLPKNTNFVFRGWGYVDEAESQLADTMQKTTARLFVDYKDGVNSVDLFDVRYGFYKTACTDAVAAECQWYQKDYTVFYSTATGRPTVGDSGSPVIHNNRIFGVLSKSNINYVHQHQMADLTLLMDAFVPYFNKVLYPYSPGKHIKSGDTTTYSIAVPVQNMTPNAILFTPVLNDSTGLFTADMTDCDRLVESKDGCVINVTFNAANQAITTEKSASIYLASGLNIPLTVDFKSITSSVVDSGNTGNAGSGGGSSNGILLFILALLFTWRSQMRKTERY
ncbi:trypsin-like serine protease [Vibrio cholerae]|nr:MULTISPECIES: trypsin-like serine protease [Vibrio]EGS66698.1 trypsin family protein [Vibrio paracholerae HE-09]MBW5419844.1 trypsin-like serine protease [Vibrio cholerae]